MIVILPDKGTGRCGIRHGKGLVALGRQILQIGQGAGGGVLNGIELPALILQGSCLHRSQIHHVAAFKAQGVENRNALAGSCQEG